MDQQRRIVLGLKAQLARIDQLPQKLLAQAFATIGDEH